MGSIIRKIKYAMAVTLTAAASIGLAQGQKGIETGVTRRESRQKNPLVANEKNLAAARMVYEHNCAMPWIDRTRRWQSCHRSGPATVGFDIRRYRGNVRWRVVLEDQPRPSADAEICQPDERG